MPHYSTLSKTVREIAPYATGLGIGLAACPVMNNVSLSHEAYSNLPAPIAPYEYYGAVAFAGALAYTAVRHSRLFKHRIRSGFRPWEAAATTIGAGAATAVAMGAITSLNGSFAIVPTAAAFVAGLVVAPREGKKIVARLSVAIVGGLLSAIALINQGWVAPGNPLTDIPLKVIGADPNFRGIQPIDPNKPENVRFKYSYSGPAKLTSSKTILRPWDDNTGDKSRSYGPQLHMGYEACIFTHLPNAKLGTAANWDIIIHTRGVPPGIQPNAEEKSWRSDGDFIALPRLPNDICSRQGINLDPNAVPIVLPPRPDLPTPAELRRREERQHRHRTPGVP